MSTTIQDALARHRFFERLAVRYDELHREPTAWAEIEAERSAEAGALIDRSR